MFQMHTWQKLYLPPQLFYCMCSGVVSEVPRDAAGADAKFAPEVNSQRLFTRERTVADAPTPSEGRALNTREHILFITWQVLVL